MGFRSPNALQFCEKAGNTHKTWELIQIIFYGTGDRILKAYIQCNPDPSARGFWQWVQNVSNDTMFFMADLIFNYILALHLYKDAIRYANAKQMLVCRTKFARLFYVTNMTCYQEIWYRDTLMRLRSPAEVNAFIEHLDCIRINDGHPAQGGDFLLENINLVAKEFCPEGVPSSQEWETILRTLQCVQKVNKIISILKCCDVESI